MLSGLTRLCVLLNSFLFSELLQSTGLLINFSTITTVLVDKEATFRVDHLTEVVLVIIREARIPLEWRLGFSFFLLIGALVGARRRFKKCRGNLQRTFIVGVSRRGWLSGRGLLLSQFTLTSLGYGAP